MDREWLFDYTYDHMRRLRHDFMNYLQVIYGYLQINKPGEAIEYIKKINSTMFLFSEIGNINPKILSVLILELIYQCSKYNIEFEFLNENEYIYEHNFSKDIDRTKKVFVRAGSMVVDWIRNSSTPDRRLYLNIRGTGEIIRITISDSNKLISEIKEEKSMCYSKDISLEYEEDDFTVVAGDSNLAVILYF